MKPQELIAFPVGRDLRLLGTELLGTGRQPEFVFEHLRDESQCLLRLLVRSTGNHEIIGIPREAEPMFFELPIETV